MTAKEILDGVLARERGWRDAKTRPNGSIDPPTMHGVTMDTLRTYREKYLGTPPQETNLPDLKALTELEAEQIFAIMYVQEPGFTPENVPYEPLRVQLIDFGVNSGPARAVRWLQRVLGLSGGAITGRLDTTTLHCLQDCTVTFGRPYLALVNDALVAARAYMIDTAVDHGTVRVQDEEGLESRALSFFLAKP